MGIFKKLGRQIEQFKQEAKAATESTAESESESEADTESKTEAVTESDTGADARYRCTECDARFDAERERCPECGSEEIRTTERS